MLSVSTKAKRIPKKLSLYKKVVLYLFMYSIKDE